MLVNTEKQVQYCGKFGLNTSPLPIVLCKQAHCFCEQKIFVIDFFFFYLLLGCQIWLRLVGRLMHRVKKVKLEDETEGSWKRYECICSGGVIVTS